MTKHTLYGDKQHGRGMEWTRAAQHAMRKNQNAQKTGLEQGQAEMENALSAKSAFFASIKYPVPVGLHLRRDPEKDSFLRGGDLFRHDEHDGLSRYNVRTKTLQRSHWLTAVKNTLQGKKFWHNHAEMPYQSSEPAMTACEEEPTHPMPQGSTCRSSFDRVDIQRDCLHVSTKHGQDLNSWIGEKIKKDLNKSEALSVQGPSVTKHPVFMDGLRRKEFTEETALQRQDKRALFQLRDFADGNAVTIEYPQQASCCETAAGLTKIGAKSTSCCDTSAKVVTDNGSSPISNATELRLTDQSRQRNITSTPRIRMCSAEARDVTLNHWSTDESSYQDTESTLTNFARIAGTTTTPEWQARQAIIGLAERRNALDSIEHNSTFQPSDESLRSSFCRLHLTPISEPQQLCGKENQVSIHQSHGSCPVNQSQSIQAIKSQSQKKGKVKDRVKAFETKIESTQIEAATMQSPGTESRKVSVATNHADRKRPYHIFGNSSRGVPSRLGINATTARIA